MSKIIPDAIQYENDCEKCIHKNVCKNKDAYQSNVKDMTMQFYLLLASNPGVENQITFCCRSYKDRDYYTP